MSKWPVGYHEYWERCRVHDWWYEMAEDPRNHKAGREAELALEIEAGADRKKAEILEAFRQFNKYGADEPKKENFL